MTHRVLVVVRTASAWHLLLASLLAFELFAAQTPQVMSVGVDQRDSLTLIVYDNNLAVVRDKRTAVLPAGLLEVEFPGIARQIKAESMFIAASEVSVLEQNYRFDLLDKKAILQRFIGRKLKYSRSVSRDGKFEKVLREGILLAVDPEIVQFGDEVEIDPEGTISLGYLPQELKASPTLLWLVENGATGEKTIDATYVTDDVSWSADYVLLLREKGGKASFSAWANLTNRSGADFNNATLQLLSGDIKTTRMRPGSPERYTSLARGQADLSMPVQTPVADYYAFEIPRPTTLRNNESKQLRLFGDTQVSATRVLKSTSQVNPHESGHRSTKHADLYYEFINSDRRGRGEPLPRGVVRVYQERNGTRFLLGEDRLGHTPKDEKVSLHVGQAFDVLIERVEVAHHQAAPRVVEARYEVTVRNRSRARVTVALEEQFAVDATVTQPSQEPATSDAHSTVWQVTAPAGASSTLTYSVQLRF